MSDGHCWHSFSGAHLEAPEGLAWCCKYHPRGPAICLPCDLLRFSGGTWEYEEKTHGYHQSLAESKLALVEKLSINIAAFVIKKSLTTQLST